MGAVASGKVHVLEVELLVREGFLHAHESLDHGTFAFRIGFAVDLESCRRNNGAHNVGRSLRSEVGFASVGHNFFKSLNGSNLGERSLGGRCPHGDISAACTLEEEHDAVLGRRLETSNGSRCRGPRSLVVLEIEGDGFQFRIRHRSSLQVRNILIVIGILRP